MKTREAIEFCEIHRWKNPRSALTLEGFKNVEILLERGEKFEAMWGELEEEYGNIHHFYSITNERFCTGNEVISYLSETMKHIRQKYFPKEVVK